MTVNAPTTTADVPVSVAAGEPSRSPRRRKRRAPWVSYLLLTVAVVIVLGPFFVALLTTFKTDADFKTSSSVWPREFTVENYARIFTEIPMALMIWNGLFIAVLATAGSVLASLLGAFALAKLRFLGSTTMFRAILFTLLVPGTVTIIPMYVVIRFIGLVDTPWALIIPAWLGSAFSVFFLRQHLLGVPHEMYEAAVLDGCSVPRIIFQIFLPLVKGPIAILSILGFIGSWNDLLGPLIYLNSPEKMTPTVGLTFFQGQYETEFPVLLAGAVIVLIPTTIIFLIFNRHIRDGLAFGGGLK